MIGGGLIRRLGRVRNDEGGAVLVLVAICMVFLLGVVGLAIDIGSWYQTQRQAQAAADAAALAGSQDLPGNPTTASTDASAYVNKNIADATTTVTTPYLSSSSQIAVTVTVKASVWFAKIFGISAPTVTATAAASKSTAASPAAVFSFDSTCANQALTINGGTISGSVHSNGSFFMNGNNDAFGASSYGGPNNCAYTGNGTGNTYGGAPVPTRDSTLESWPSDYSVSPPACTYSSSSFTFNTSGVPLLPGVYCASGQISINGNNLTGNVTFIANSFNLNGSGENFTPFTQNLLVYQTGTNALDINGNDFVTLGTVFAPNASVVLNGNGGTVSGFIEGLDVTINGNGLTFVGNGPGASSGGSSLIQ